MLSPIAEPRRARAAWLAPALIALAGCQNVPMSNPTPTARAEADAIKADAALTRTDFHHEIAPEKEPAIHADLARACELQGNDQGALDEYQKALTAAEAHRRRGRAAAEFRATLHRRQAGALDRLGRFAEAEAHYQAARKLNPADPKLWNDLGYSYYLQGRLADAEKALRSAARRAPSDPRTLTNLGLALAAAGKIDAARETLTRAGNPATAEANLGYLLAATNRPDEARRHYRRALEIQPNLEIARAALARLDAEAARGQVR